MSSRSEGRELLSICDICDIVPAIWSTYIMDKQHESNHIEIESSSDNDQKHDKETPQVVGNVQILCNNEVVLVPTPSPDPKGT